MGFYARIARPVLFSLDAETAHNLTLAALANPLGRVALHAITPPAADARLGQRVFGIDVTNPIGLAAGLDKQGTAIAAWEALGFGFAEIGTVTPRPQPGNARPRLFRLPADEAIINRFGFNSEGSQVVSGNLARQPRGRLRLGVNIGRNKDTPNESAGDDYAACVAALRAQADYLVINVSSPNTAGLRDLQEARTLRDLVGRVVAEARGVPVLVKISPDMTPPDLLHAVDAVAEGGASGIVATNTTLRRDVLAPGSSLAAEAGGLSGRPLRAAANETCRTLFKHVGSRLPIIGVGGIFSADDAYERVKAGATLIQLYTALVYEGAGVVGRMATGLAQRLERDGYSNIREVVGTDVH